MLTAAFLSSVPAYAGQSAPDRPAYEVASVKLRTDCDERTVPPSITPDSIRFSCVKVANLIATAYSVMGASFLGRKPTVLGGPSWVDRDRYDVLAKAQGRRSMPDLLGPMLLALLEERFSLKADKELRESPIYALTLSKGGPKLQPAPEGSCIPLDSDNLLKTGTRPPNGTPMCGLGGSSIQGGYVLTEDWPGVTMTELADRMLSFHVDRPVVDKTGLKGRFNVKLKFRADSALELPPEARGAEVAGASADSEVPSLFEALQDQLGLRLSPDRGPREVIVIEHIERPSAN